MDILFLLIALVLVGLVGYMAYAKSQRDQRTFNSLYKPADEPLLNEQTELDESGSDGAQACLVPGDRATLRGAIGRSDHDYCRLSGGRLPHQ